MADQFQIDDLRLQEQDQDVVIEIDVTNNTARTLHAHVTPRKVRYDVETRALAIELTDENLPTDTLSTHGLLPRFKAIDPKAHTTIQVRLPRIMHRLGAQTNNGAPVIDTLPIHEAQNLQATVAWSDTPFYPDPRERTRGEPSDVAKWQKGSAIGTARVVRAEPPRDGTSRTPPPSPPKKPPRRRRAT